MAERIPVYPQYGHSALAWRVSEGQTVEKGKIIALNERESAKGSAGIAAPATGVVVELAEASGEVDQAIAYVEVQ